MRNALQRAAHLAGWLIRTERQSPGDAIRIAAHKFGADCHAVAQRVGARGGRRAAEARRKTAAVSASTPPWASRPATPLTILVVSVEPRDLFTRLKGRLLDGPLAEIEMSFDFPPTVLPPSVKADDRLRFAASYGPGAYGPTSVVLR